MLEVHLMLSRLPGIQDVYNHHLIWNWQWVCWSWWWWSMVEIFFHNVWRWSCQSSVPPNHQGKNFVYPRYQNTEMLSLSSVPHQHWVSMSIQIQTIICIISLNSFYLISIIRIKQRIVWRLNTIYNCVSKPRYFKSCCISRAISFENNSETVAAAGDWYGICVATSFDNQTFIRIINCKYS